MMKPTHIVIHHSLTKDGATVSWSAIRNFHMTDPAHMFSDIGYHAGVELAGSSYEVFLGRPWDVVGAHCKSHGMNRISLGVCIVGNFDDAPPSDEMLDVAARYVILPWMRIFGIEPAAVRFHRDWAPDRSCPGKMFTRELLAKHIHGVMPDDV